MVAAKLRARRRHLKSREAVLCQLLTYETEAGLLARISRLIRSAVTSLHCFAVSGRQTMPGQCDGQLARAGDAVVLGSRPHKMQVLS